MLQKTVESLYGPVIQYLRQNYVFDPESKIPRSQVYEDYVVFQKDLQNASLNLPEIKRHHMGYVVRIAFPREVGNRTRIVEDDGRTFIDCYCLKKSNKSCFFLLYYQNFNLNSF
jgi:hypothetical protein